MASPDQLEGSENGTIGQRIKDLRKEQNLTLAEVAAAARLSASHLSQIERNKTVPSLMTVASVADALNVNVRELFESSDSQVFLQRAHRQSSMNGDFTAGSCNGTDGAIRVRGRSRSHGSSSSREPGSLELPGFTGEVLAFVLDGVLSVELGDEVYDLGTGDSIHFDASIGQRVYCLGEKPCAILVVQFTTSPAPFRRSGSVRVSPEIVVASIPWSWLRQVRKEVDLKQVSPSLRHSLQTAGLHATVQPTLSCRR